MNINLGDEVRMLAVDSPDLVVNKNLVKCVQNINFSLTEEMGFRKAFNNIREGGGDCVYYIGTQSFKDTFLIRWITNFSILNFNLQKVYFYNSQSLVLSF